MKLFRNIIFLILLLTLCTCKKYPEDKFLSFTTVKMRLQGEWQLERIEINGENIGHKYNDSLAPLTFKDFKFWFVFDYPLETSSGYKKETKNVLAINTTSRNKSDATKNVDVSGTAFYFHPEKEKTSLNIGTAGYIIPTNDNNSSNIVFNFLSTYNWQWQIRTLYNKIFIIEKTKNDLKYRLSFKKIRNN